MIVEDAVFLYSRAKEDKTDDKYKKRYARIAILLMSLYLESLSNLIFEELVNRNLEEVCYQTDLPKPIRRFRAVYHMLSGKELALNTDGLQDIFTIRNKIIAHPAGCAQLQTSRDGWVRTDRQVTYKKFGGFPLVYSHFTLQHANAVFEEVRQFLTKFLDILGDKLPKEQVDKWWPAELVQWSKELSKH